jgi:thiamine biosynthesis lipoprotein
MAVERRFRAMGGDAHVVVVGDGGLLDLAERRIADLEARWSRFVPTSEVSRINARAGTAVLVSPDTALLVRRAAEAWHLTAGSFDPTLLGAVVRAGYDRTFEHVADRGPVRSALTTGCAHISADATSVQLPDGCGFDPGGIGKGLAADLVVGELLAAGAEGACVNLGGDIRVAGAAPAGGGWTLAVEHPVHGTLDLLGVADGALATSTTLRRRWTVGGEPRHHLIDPGTGLPADSDLDLAAVVAREAWIAEVLAKAVLLRGADRAFQLLAGTGVEGLAVTTGGTVLASPGLGAFRAGTGPLPRTA